MDEGLRALEVFINLHFRSLQTRGLEKIFTDCAWLPSLRCFLRMSLLFLRYVSFKYFVSSNVKPFRI